MRVLTVRNVHEALPEAIYVMLHESYRQDSRNGPVLRHPMPVTTCYTHPRERVVFWPERDANPFFHFFEGLWMLNGQNDVATLTQYVGRMKDFSDDGKIFHGAYGHRWRKHWEHDQLEHIAAKLRHDHTDRRQVLQMYDAGMDAVTFPGARDIPCNLVACFQVNNSRLDMIVYNRSNDIIWGCYGANAVHFSMLQEVMAAMIGVPVGMYWQVSFNWHAYLTTLEPLQGLQFWCAQPPSAGNRTPYEGDVEPYPMVNGDWAVWLQDLRMFMSEGYSALGYRDSFFRRVAIPMLRTHRAFKGGGDSRFERARAEAGGIYATDWKRAVLEWIDRRETRFREKADGGNQGSLGER